MFLSSDNVNLIVQDLELINFTQREDNENESDADVCEKWILPIDSTLSSLKNSCIVPSLNLETSRKRKTRKIRKEQVRDAYSQISQTLNFNDLSDNNSPFHREIILLAQFRQIGKVLTSLNLPHRDRQVIIRYPSRHLPSNSTCSARMPTARARSQRNGVVGGFSSDTPGKWKN